MKRIRQILAFVIALGFLTGCRTGGVVGHKNGMEVAKGERLVQYKAKGGLSNVFINGILCERVQDRFFAKVPILYKDTPVVVATVTPQGKTVVLDIFTLKAWPKGLPTESPISDQTIFIDNPPDGMVIHAP